MNAVIQFGSASGVAILGTGYFGLLANVPMVADVAPATLWYNVAAFTLTVVCSRFLPGRKQPE